MEGVIGYVTMFAGTFAPKSWAFCNGQTINIASNTALFSSLGTTYGGNGTTTFQLPNTQNRTVVGRRGRPPCPRRTGQAATPARAAGVPRRESPLTAGEGCRRP